MSTPQIIVLGSVNVDLVIRSPLLPRAGETVIGGAFYEAAGGKGANQAVAAARASAAPIGFIAAVGSDDFGRRSLKQLRGENILTQHVRMVEGAATGVALIMVDEHGENQISVASGANALLTPDDVAAVADEWFESAKVFVASLESPIETVISGLRRAKEHGLTTVLNPAPACEEIRNPEILKLVDVLTPNETEATFLSGWDVLEDLEDVCIWCEQLRQKGSRSVVITRGERGCVVREEVGDPSLIAPYVVSAVDATAAGDCFNGALAAALAEGRTLIEAARFANAAAALSVQNTGAVPSLPTRTAIDNFAASDAPQRDALL
ncbi:ribokinase [bacterium]|nr:ribokinase [bacterium]